MSLEVEQAIERLRADITRADRLGHSRDIIDVERLRIVLDHVSRLEGAMRQAANLAQDGRRTANLPTIARLLNETLNHGGQNDR